MELQLAPKIKRPAGEPRGEPPVYPGVQRGQATRMAAVAKALGDPVRLQLIDVLRKHAGKVCVCELVPLFELSQPTVSHHLKVLRDAGIVGSERQGLWAYYFVVPAALDELTAAEAEELGPLLRAVTRALRVTTGCGKTYVALFAEAEGFAHVHFHVVPRHGDLDPGLRGPRVFNLLGQDPDRSVPDAAMDEIALRIAAALTARRETTGRPGT